MEQIWKDVQDYEGLYQVSNDGDVISLRFEPPKHIYQTITNCGYKQVLLYKNGKKKRVGVHILVAQKFVDGWFDGAEVNHKDLNKTNNRAENLEWITHSGNQKHQYYLYHPEHKVNCCRICGKELTSQTAKYCLDCMVEKRRESWPKKEELEHDIQYFSILEIGRKYNCSDNMIRKMLKAYNLPFKRKDIIKLKQENGTYIPPKQTNVMPFEERYVFYEVNGIRKTANAWSIYLGLDSKRVGRYAKKHSYDDTIEYIKSFIQ